jgi:hypothetical protein
MVVRTAEPDVHPFERSWKALYKAYTDARKAEKAKAAQQAQPAK